MEADKSRMPFTAEEQISLSRKLKRLHAENCRLLAKIEKMKGILAKNKIPYDDDETVVIVRKK